MSVRFIVRFLAVSAMLLWGYVGWAVTSRSCNESGSHRAESLASHSGLNSPAVSKRVTEGEVHSELQLPLLGESDLALLIQDPPTRHSAFRPDFSSTFRSRNYRNNYFMLQAFKEAVIDCRRSTVQVISDGEQCSLGTIVDSDGWIVTKSSELDADRAIECILADNRTFNARIVSTLPELDIALLRIPSSGLPTVEWEYAIPDQGKWLATTDAHSGLPAAIGVVSTGASKVDSHRAVMGIELGPDESGDRTGAKVKHVVAGTGADRGGLMDEDVIVGVNGTPTNSREQLLKMLSNGKGGQFVSLAVLRNDAKVELRVRLMDLPAELMDSTELEVNGPISARSSGFHRVFMHDTVLQPNQCGGPVFNLDGKAVGINIARAGRVSTYALPSDTIRPAIDDLLAQAKLVSRQSAPAESRDSLPLATAP